MRPLPVSGGMQRESGTFFVPFPYINQPILFHFNCIPKMKKELTLGAPSVPVLRIDAERFRKLLNRVLPAECQVKNATDCWYVGAAVSGVLSAMMPWLLPLAVYCVCRAKKGEKGGER